VTGGPDLRLEQNVPNPFGRSTTIRFAVPSEQEVRLEIFSASGQRVACLVDGRVPRGWSQVAWDSKDERGHEVAAGAYFCRLSTKGGSPVTRMMLVR
jgi:flagellar hook assembly protein FlgD